MINNLFCAWDIREDRFSFYTDVVSFASSDFLILNNREEIRIKDIKIKKEREQAENININVGDILKKEVLKNVFSFQKDHEIKEEMKEVEVEGEVFFNFDSYIIECEQKEKIKKLVEEFKNKVGDRKIFAEVFGFTDVLGKKLYNIKLSEKRAESVSRLLNDLGVEVSIIKGLGEVKESCVFGLNRKVRFKLKVKE